MDRCVAHQRGHVVCSGSERCLQVAPRLGLPKPRACSMHRVDRLPCGNFEIERVPQADREYGKSGTFG